jgi:hypothetical protein
MQFLFRGYTEERYYWELVVFGRKFFLTFFAVFTEYMNVQTRSTLLCIVLLGLLELSMSAKPYYSNVLNRLEIASLFITYMTANLGILMRDQKSPELVATLVIFVLMMHLSFFVAWILAIVISLYEKNKVVHEVVNTVVGDEKVIASGLYQSFSESKLTERITCAKDMIFLFPLI